MTPDNQLLIGIDEAAERLSMSRMGLYSLIRRGLVKPIYLDRRPRIVVSDLVALIDQVRDHSERNREDTP